MRSRPSSNVNCSRRRDHHRRAPFRLSDEEMLQISAETLRAKGFAIRHRHRRMRWGCRPAAPTAHALAASLRAYSLVGFSPDRDYRYVEINRELRKLHPGILREVLDGLRATGSDAWQDLQTDRVIVNGEFSLSVVVARCIETPTGLLRWQLRFDTSLAPDITVVVRMDSANRAPLDYYLFPASTCSPKSCGWEDNALGLDAYRFDGLDLLYDIATPIRLAEAA